MSDINLEELAFPITHANQTYATGMTLRDYFAAKAMQGILACESDSGVPAFDIAEFAYAQADAMLKVRETNA